MEGKEFEVIGKSDEHEAYLVEVPKYTGRYIYYVDCDEVTTDSHYDNTNGSLYKFAEDHGLNAYEFETIKRVVRSRKKGEFISDIEKTIRVLNLYLEEQKEKYEGQYEKLN
jgi:hypothetical protein